MSMSTEIICNVLRDAFSTWLRAAADECGVNLGDPMRFSESQIFYPDCTTSVGGDIYVENEKLSHIRIPLFINSETVIEDLLRYEPGAFRLEGNMKQFSSWNEVSSEQAKDYLWYALVGWFEDFSYTAEFEIGRRKRELEDFKDPIWMGCYFSQLSGPLKLRFRSKE